MGDELVLKGKDSIARWNTLSEETKQAMKELGDFGITYGGDTIKGYGTFGDDEPGKSYWNASDLRKMAKAMLEVADILV